MRPHLCISGLCNWLVQVYVALAIFYQLLKVVFPCKVDFSLVTKNSVERLVFSVIQLGVILFCWSV